MSKYNLKLKIIAGILWLCLIGVFISWYISTGLSISEFVEHVSMYITNFVEMFGIWGGLLYILVYTILVY